MRGTCQLIVTNLVSLTLLEMIKKDYDFYKKVLDEAGKACRDKWSSLFGLFVHDKQNVFIAMTIAANV